MEHKAALLSLAVLIGETKQEVALYFIVLNKGFKRFKSKYVNALETGSFCSKPFIYLARV